MQLKVSVKKGKNLLATILLKTYLSPAMGRLNRKLITKTLSTGHEIQLVATDVKVLRNAFEYMAGFVKRRHLALALAKKHDEIQLLEALINAGGNNNDNNPETSQSNDENLGPEDEEGNNNGLSKNNNTTTTNNSNGIDLRTEEEMMQDNFFQAKEEYRILQEKQEQFTKLEHKINIQDLDEILKNLGAPQSHKSIEFMIWEVDEHGDNMIDWDEFQLTYWRNVNAGAGAGTEPCNFFNILEFITFDGHKGFILEDDVMEILFTRYGPARLEQELAFIFGDKLRSRGGDGTTSLNDYLSAVLSRTGRRAIPQLA